ncbi:MAG: adenosine kinase [Actinomycetota bacterium]
MSTPAVPGADGAADQPITTAGAVDVVGVGNAIVDVLATTSDEFVLGQGLEKGSMSLIDEHRALELYGMLGESIRASGGSAANTMAGIASFGGSAAYIGKVSDDELGKVFAEDMTNIGVRFEQPPRSDGPSTAMCLVLVTPDAQRTLNTYLGVSALLEPDDVRPEVVQRAPLLFCEGYLWDVESAKQAIRKAMDLAIDAGSKVALTLSDTFCIERHHQEFSELVAGPVDILFANKAELTRLYETDLDSAVKAVAEQVELACVTLSEEGSWLVSNGEIIEIAAEEVADVIDTTGAGDQYAAGVLYGLARGLPLPEVGRLGSLAAAEVISHLGPRPERPLSDFLR